MGFFRLGIAKHASASLGKFEYESWPKIDMESLPIFPGNYGIKNFTKNLVLTGNTTNDKFVKMRLFECMKKYLICFVCD